MSGRLLLGLVVLAATLPARADIPPPPPPPPDRPALPVLGIAPPAAGQVAIAGVLLALGAISAGLSLARRYPQGSFPLKAAGLGVGIVLLGLAGLLAVWSRRAEADFQRQKAERERVHAEERRNWRPRGPVEPRPKPPEPGSLAPPATDGAPAP
jgi:hypothetical protein